jgi:hypothetical protein
MKRLLIISVTLISFGGFITANAKVPARYNEGGACSAEFLDAGAAFVSYFDAPKRYYYTYAPNWTTKNNISPYGVDRYDFMYYNGHGGPYQIKMADESWIDLRTAGSSNNNGYGDYYLKFLVLHSCQTVPSPIDVSDWGTPWLQEPGGIFDGLHILLGFRTYASGDDHGYNILYSMGNLTSNCSGTVISNWINSVDTYGAPDDQDEYCIMSAYRDGHFDDPTYDSWYDVYGVQHCVNTTNPDLWCVWSESGY